MNELVHAFRGVGLDAATDTIIFDTVCYVNEPVRAFMDAGPGAVTDTIVLDIALYEWISTRT